MKEVIYFLPNADAGVASVIRNLLKYRPQSDVYYKVILTTLIERKSNLIKDQFNADEQIVFEYSKNENLYAVCKRLKKFISNENSILVANDSLELRMVQLLRMINPLVYIMHGDFNFYYLQVKTHYGIIDRFISISQYITQQLAEKTGCLDKINTAYFPVVDINLSSKDNQKDIDLLFVGSLNMRKGVQFLNPIFKNIQKKLPNVKLTIVGSGELLEQLKSEFNLEPNVKFTGQLNGAEVHNLMLKSKLLLFPSSAEGLPNVVVEAMKSACVPICNDIPSGVPDLIDNGVTGFIVPFNSISDFSEKATEMLTDDLKRKEIALNAREKALKMFDPLENAQIYEILFLTTSAQNKIYINKTLGGILNQPYMPYGLVKFIRTLNISEKL